MPLRGNYSPVVLNIRFLASILAVDYNSADGQATLATCVDPIIYLWKPYGTTLTVPSVTVRDGSGSTRTYKIQHFGDYLRAHAGSGSQPALQFTITDSGSPLVMAPGEILVVSPTPRSGLQPMPVGSPPLYDFQASPGYNFTPGNGYYLNKLGLYTTNPSTGADAYSGNAIVRFDTKTTTIDATFSPPQIKTSSTQATSSGRFWFNSSLAGGNQPIQQLNVNISAPPDGEDMTAGTLNGITSSEYLNRKNWLGQVSYSLKPTSAMTYRTSAGATRTSPPVEVFGRFNPLPIIFAGPWRLSPYDRFYSLSYGSSLNQLLGAGGQSLEAASGRRGYWGRSYDSSGSSFLPMLAIPSTPLLSLASFRHAALGLYGFEPLHPVGNSLSNPFIPGNLLADKSDYLSYGPDCTDTDAPWAFDSSWLINDALWDRHFLSGIAPEYSIGAGGYSMAAGSAAAGITQTLTRFFSPATATAKASPAIYEKSGKNLFQTRVFWESGVREFVMITPPSVPGTPLNLQFISEVVQAPQAQASNFP